MSFTAEWVQAITGIIAVIGLLYTLLLQRRTAEDQKSMLLISQESSRKHLMPAFKASLQEDYDEFGQYFGVVIVVELERNDSYNTSFSICENNPINNNDNFAPPRTFKVRDTLYISYNSPSDKLECFTDAINIDFTDLDERQYRQTIQVYKKTINITAPRLMPSMRPIAEK